MEAGSEESETTERLNVEDKKIQQLDVSSGKEEMGERNGGFLKVQEVRGWDRIKVTDR